MHILEGDEKCSACIGLISSASPLNQQPGTSINTFGYKGLDGRFFYHGSNPRGKEYGPTFGAGDVIGCGVDFARCVHMGDYGDYLIVSSLLLLVLVLLFIYFQLKKKIILFLFLFLL